MAGAGHANVRQGYVGNECLNFTMEPTTIREGWKYASIEKFESKARFTDGGLVFMWSRDPQWPKPRIVGVMAAVDRLASPELFEKTPVGGLQFNLRFPAVNGLAIRFVVPVPVVPDRHLRDGDVVKRRPGQACGCYIDDDSATRILVDAAKDCASTQGLQRLLGWRQEAYS